MDEPRVDPLSPVDRSERMAKVRNVGNKSTEQRVESALIKANILGWEKHPKAVLGRPDFFFPDHGLAVFIDGCFWHDCPTCRRRIPVSRREFWQHKIEGNRKRDNRQRRQLRKQGYHVMRVWEHEINKGLWLKRLQSMRARIEKDFARKRVQNSPASPTTDCFGGEE